MSIFVVLIVSHEKKMIARKATTTAMGLRNAIAINRIIPLLINLFYKKIEIPISRYQSGLANLADLIQAQYAFTKADADKRIAYMAVWKALLYKAAVNGDLNFFVKQVN